MKLFMRLMTNQEKMFSKWTRDTSQALVDSREPENNWIDGVYDMIQSLRYEGYKIGIVTSDSERSDTIFEETHSKDAFDLVISLKRIRLKTQS